MFLGSKYAFESRMYEGCLGKTSGFAMIDWLYN